MDNKRETMEDRPIKRARKSDEESDEESDADAEDAYSIATTSNEEDTRHLVLDHTTTRTGDDTTRTTIEEGEFSESQTLETVKILESSGITCFGEKAFSDCKSLQSMKLQKVFRLSEDLLLMVVIHCNGLILLIFQIQMVPMVQMVHV